LLEEINAAVEETGLRTSIVDVAPMARYNRFATLQQSEWLLVAHVISERG